MSVMIFYTSVISILYLLSPISSHNSNNPFSSPNDFLSWILDSDFKNVIEQSMKKSDHLTVEDCIKLEPRKRDKCYHDLAQKHRQRAPSAEPVFDDNGNLIFFTEAPPYPSHENPPWNPDLVDDKDKEISFPKTNHQATKSTIKFKQLSNGENIITVVKEGNILSDSKEKHHDNHHKNHATPCDVHVSPVSAHNMQNIHDESSSEINNTRDDSDHHFSAGKDEHPLKENQFRVTGTLKNHEAGYKEDPYGQMFQYSSHTIPTSYKNPSGNQEPYYYSYY